MDTVKNIHHGDYCNFLSQFLNGQLTKDLIARVNPAFLDFLSLYKNFNSNQNLPKLINYHNHA